jgi:hypothetical protein
MAAASVIPWAIRRSLEILATHRALFTAPDRKVMTENELKQLIGVFEACNADWVLVGAHAVGLVTEPRATADFDFIVEGHKSAEIIAALQVAFGDLDANEIGAAVELRALQVDLIRSTNHPLFQRALQERIVVSDWNVPKTEALVALKFLAAVSPWRDRNKRRLDIADIGTLMQARGSMLDRVLMTELASLAYPGAENEFVELLRKLEVGEPIAI